MQEILRQHFEKIIALSDEESEFILSHFTLGNLRKREFFIREGENVGHIFFIVSGLTKMILTDKDAKEHIVSFAMEDWWETDTKAFYTESKATMSMQCLEDTTYFRLSYQDYRELSSVMPKMQHFFFEKAVAAHIASQNRILALTAMNAKERFEQLLGQKPALFQRPPKSLLASYLGVSRETLSRLF